ncbi:MAG: arsenate reductase family protein [Candidatus Rokuibacteriota bacterium]
MTVQVFGFKDDQETRKALRFFAERRVAVHFVDLDQRPPAKGELRRFVEKLGAAAVIDRDGKRFRDLGLRVAGDSPQRLIERALTEPRLLRTPLVRGGHRVSIGPAPEAWRGWLEAEKQAAGP